MFHNSQRILNGARRMAPHLATACVVAAHPVFAQNAAQNAAANSASWIGYFIFIIGLIAIGIVGFSVLRRRGPRTTFASNAADEELIADSENDLQ